MARRCARGALVLLALSVTGCSLSTTDTRRRCIPTDAKQTCRPAEALSQSELGLYPNDRLQSVSPPTRETKLIRTCTYDVTARYSAEENPDGTVTVYTCVPDGDAGASSCWPEKTTPVTLRAQSDGGCPAPEDATSAIPRGRNEFEIRSVSTGRPGVETSVQCCYSVTVESSP